MKVCFDGSAILGLCLMLGLFTGVCVAADAFSDLYSLRQESDPRLEWIQFGPGMAGYNEGSWFHPTDPNYVFLGPDMYNTYRSTDGGSSWHTVRDHDGTYLREDRFIRVKDIDFSRQDENFGIGVNHLGAWYTRDKGASWTAHPLNDTNFWTQSGYWGDFLSSVAFDPTDDNVVFIGSGDFWNVKGNQRTFDQPHGASPHNPGRIFRSLDRGQTWQRADAGLDPKAEIGILIVDPKDPKIVYAGTTYGFYRSVDRGDSWQLHNQGLDNGMIRDLDMHYNEDTGEIILYAIDQVMWTPDGQNRLQTSGGIFLSCDRGETWQSITSNLGLNLQALDTWLLTNSLYHNRGLARWFNTSVADTRQYELPTSIVQGFNRIAVDPTNPDKIYISHNAAHTASFLPDAVWTTEDRGQNWYIATRFGPGWAQDAHYWQSRYSPEHVDITSENMDFAHMNHRISTSPYTPHWGVRSLTVNLRGEVIIGYAQRMHRSVDGGLSWQQVDQVETFPGSGNWVGTGNSNLPGKLIYQDPRLQGQVFLTSGEHGLWKTTDDGDSVYPGAMAATQVSEDAQSPSSIAFHPHDANTIYLLAFRQRHAGYFRVSNDGGYTWQNLSRPIPAVQDRVHQYSLMVDPQDPENIYFCVPAKIINDVGDSDRGVATGVYKSSDGGRTWEIANQGLPASASVNDMAFDPDNSHIIYAAVLQGTTSGGLYVSDDQAGSWQKLDLPAGIEQVNHVQFDPVGRLLIATGTERGSQESGGLWRSGDKGETWERIFPMPYVRRFDTAAYDPNRILATVGMNTSISSLNPGVYLSEDDGVSWVKLNIGLGQPERVMDVAFHLEDQDLFLATLWGSGFYHGRFDSDVQRVYMESIHPEPFDVLEPKLGQEVSPLEATFAWQASAGADSYRLLVARDADMQDLVVDRVVRSTEVVLSDLHSGSHYYWQVGALPRLPWHSGTNVYESVVTERWNHQGVQPLIMAAAAEVPEAPILSEVKNVLGEEIHLRWQEVPLANEYTIYRALADEEEFQPIALGLGRSVGSWVDADVRSGQTYRYYLTASNELGTSDLSRTIRVVAEPLAPTFVEDFSGGELRENWRIQGAFSINQGDDEFIGSLRAIFPRATGSLQALDVFGPSYRLDMELRISQYGTPQFAVLRVGTSVMGQDGYQLTYSYDKGMVELHRRQGGTSQSVAAFPFEFVVGQWYNLRMDYRSGLVQISIDGEPQLSWQDLVTLPGGNLELFASNTVLELRQVLISE